MIELLFGILLLVGIVLGVTLFFRVLRRQDDQDHRNT